MNIGGDASLSTFTALTDTRELESPFELAALILSRLTSIDFQCLGWLPVSFTPAQQSARNLIKDAAETHIIKSHNFDRDKFGARFGENMMLPATFNLSDKRVEKYYLHKEVPVGLKEIPEDHKDTAVY